MGGVRGERCSFCTQLCLAGSGRLLQTASDSPNQLRSVSQAA
jgi:hypothetical protein